MKWLAQLIGLLSLQTTVKGLRHLITQSLSIFRRMLRFLIPVRSLGGLGAAVVLLSACSKPSTNALVDQARGVLVIEVSQGDVPGGRGWVGFLDGLVDGGIRGGVFGHLIFRT